MRHAGWMIRKNYDRGNCSDGWCGSCARCGACPTAEDILTETLDEIRRIEQQLETNSNTEDAEYLSLLLRIRDELAEPIL